MAACCLTSAAQAESNLSLPPLTAANDAVPVTATAVPLNHQEPESRHAGQLEYWGGLKLTSSQQKFGGISGLEISSDGKQILGISDGGRWMVADVLYDPDGQLASLANVRMAPIKDLPDTEKHIVLDAEAITAVDGAGFVVSFESPHSLRYYQATGPDAYDSLFAAKAQKFTFAPDMPQAFGTLPANLGVEAITTLPDGRLLAISEHTRTVARGTLAQGWLIGHGKVEPISYDIDPAYRPTDMTTLPDGDVLVLERHLSLENGMAARLIRISSRTVATGAILKGTVVADLAFPFNVDNMEALAARRNDAGDTLIYLMSDNNFNTLQRNLMLMFRLVEQEK